MPKFSENIDIDTLEDIIRAEKIINNKKLYTST